MKQYKKRSCISTVFFFPFYLIYLAAVVCVSFLFSVFTFLWQLITMPFRRKKPMAGLEYEKFVADYLKRKGYWGVKVTRASGDFGIDVIAHKNGKKYAVQCKYYSAPVGVSAVQEAVAGKAHYGCNAAMVVTNNVFTKAAETLAADNGVKLLSEVK